MIIKQDSERLVIHRETRPWIAWLVSIILICTSLISYWISKPVFEVIILVSIFTIGIFILFRLFGIFEPRVFTFDRSNGEFILQYRTYIFKWLIEWKKVYPLDNIKKVKLVGIPGSVDESGYHEGGRRIELVIQRRKEKQKDKIIYLPGGSNGDVQYDAKRVAIFLGLIIQEETKIF